jgi:hypothetical protein
MINKLKTLAITMLATGATVTGLHAAPPAYSETNLFQPLTVTFSLYEEKSVSALDVGAAASFKTANLLTEVTDSLSNTFTKKAVLGYVTYETNLSTNLVNTLVSNSVPTAEAGTNVLDLSTSIVPLTVTTISNALVVTNLVTITNVITNTSTNFVSSTTNLGTLTNSGVTLTTNTVTNTLAIGDSGTNTITITVTNGTTNITVVAGTNTTTYTNLSDLTLSGTTATVGTNAYTVETNVVLTNSTSTNSIAIDTSAVTIETNGAIFASLIIGTNTVTIDVTNSVVSVTVGATNVTISTNFISSTNGSTNIVTLTTTVGTNVVTTNGETTNALTNLVLIGSNVVVSNGVIAGITNALLTNTIDTTLTFALSSNDVASGTNVSSTTNYTAFSTYTNQVITNITVITNSIVLSTNAVLVAAVPSASVTNVQTVGITTSNVVSVIGAGSRELVVQDQSGSGASLIYTYTPVPTNILEITPVPETNEIDVASVTTHGTTTNETDYSIKRIALTAPSFTFKAQGLVHSTLDYVTVASATLNGKKIAVTNETFTFVSGYGTNVVSGTIGTNFVLSGTAAIGTPAQDKQLKP